jgi:hypothetical protein
MEFNKMSLSGHVSVGFTMHQHALQISVAFFRTDLFSYLGADIMSQTKGQAYTSKWRSLSPCKD